MKYLVIQKDNQTDVKRVTHGIDTETYKPMHLTRAPLLEYINRGISCFDPDVGFYLNNGRESINENSK